MKKDNETFEMPEQIPVGRQIFGWKSSAAGPRHRALDGCGVAVYNDGCIYILLMYDCKFHYIPWVENLKLSKEIFSFLRENWEEIKKTDKHIYTGVCDGSCQECSFLTHKVDGLCILEENIDAAFNKWLKAVCEIGEKYGLDLMEPVAALNARLRNFAQKWLDYFQIHDENECFKTYTEDAELEYEFQDLGLQADGFQSFDLGMRYGMHCRPWSIKNNRPQTIDMRLDYVLDPYFLGNALYSDYCYMKFWCENPRAHFNKERYMKIFRKIIKS